MAQTGTILGAVYAYIVSGFRRFSGLVYLPIANLLLDLGDVPCESIRPRDHGDGSCV